MWANNLNKNWNSKKKKTKFEKINDGKANKLEILIFFKKTKKKRNQRIKRSKLFPEWKEEKNETKKGTKKKQRNEKKKEEETKKSEKKEVKKKKVCSV